MGHPRFHDDLMRAHALDRRITSRHLGDNGVVIVRVEPSLVTDLPTGIRIERRVVEDYLAGFSRLEFPRTLPVVDDSEHFAAVGAGLAIAYEKRFRELSIRRAGAL